MFVQHCALNHMFVNKDGSLFFLNIKGQLLPIPSKVDQVIRLPS